MRVPLLAVLALVVLASGCVAVQQALNAQMRIPRETPQQPVADYGVVFYSDLSARINFTIYDRPKLREFYEVRLPADAVITDFHDDRGRIEDYNVTHGNYTTQPDNRIVRYKDVAFLTNDMERNATQPITMVYLTNSSYSNNTPLYYDADIWGMGVAENVTVILPDGFYFMPQNRDVKAGNFIVSVDARRADIRYIDAKGPGNRPVMGFLRNATIGNWTITELDRYVLIMENPSPIETGWVVEAERHFSLLENITGFRSPYPKFTIIVHNSTNCANACAGWAGFVAQASQPNALRPETVIHESMHSLIFQLLKGSSFDKLPTAEWFNEGLATYAENLFANDTRGSYRNKLQYDELKEFYLAEEKVIDDMQFLYSYTAFTWHAYVQQCGEGALRQMFSSLGEFAGSNYSQIPASKVIGLMNEACGSSFTEEDIDMPYRELLLANETAFREKISGLVVTPPDPSSSMR